MENHLDMTIILPLSLAGQLSDVLAAEEDFARRGLLHVHNRLEEGGLAATRFADDRYGFAFAHVEGYIVARRQESAAAYGEFLREVFDAQNHFRHNDDLRFRARLPAKFWCRRLAGD